jgi:hypothetical protein
MEALYPNGGQCRLFTDQPVWFKITTLTTTLMNGTEKKIQFASYQAFLIQKNICMRIPKSAFQLQPIEYPL